MALGTIGAAVAGSLASSAASFGLSKLGESSLSGAAANPTAGLASFAPPGIDAGGLKTSFGSGGVGVSSSRNRRGLVGNLASTFPEQAGEIAGLRGLVAPGVSALRSSRLGEIENARRRSVGNLRENLQRRRVLGSSFGQDAVVRAEKEFAQERERVAAESTLQELEMTHALIGEEFNARRGEFSTFLDEMNLQANLATQIATGATATLGSMAQLEARLAAQEAQSSGAFFGQTFQPVVDAIGSGVSSFASGGFGSSVPMPTRNPLR